ncbi:Chitinase 4 [Neonectria punicea]|uniref:chitinase n=1 Tax=Neonectria punicea TaxID=979145 RepID=A0ABR1GHL5_9HYPO
MIFNLLLFCIGTLSYAVAQTEDSKGTRMGVYARGYQPQNLRATDLTQVLYAFLNLKADGEVHSGDTYADLEKHYPADSWDEAGVNAYGCVKQLYLLKKQHRSLKVILSIGGWTWSNNFPSAAATVENRERFAKSAVKLMGDWGFDGVDVDWEYPADETESSNFILLLQAVREGLDAYAQQHAPGYHFILSIASPAGPTYYKNLDLKSLSDIVDSFNLMAYDYAGSWDTVSGHQSNLFPSDSSAFSTTTAVQDYVAAGVNPAKIILGMPLYGRAFENTDGIGNPFDGVGSGSWENGVWDYKALPRQGAIEKMDSELVASYSYDPGSRELISYDTPEVVKAKVSWLKEAGLAGSMFWEASGDGRDDKGLIRTSSTALGTLDTGLNLLSYPNSQYANIAAGMPET